MVSEEIKRFLDFVEENRSIYNMAMESMKQEDKKLQDFLHAVEFEASAKERSKICTRLHKSRNARRRYKDTVEEREGLWSSSRTRSTKRRWSSCGSCLAGYVRWSGTTRTVHTRQG